MTWDNIKVGFFKTWSEDLVFRTIMIYAATIAVCSIFWTMGFFLTINDASYKIILRGFGLGLITAVVIIFIKDVLFKTYEWVQELNNLGETEKERVFKALKEEVPNNKDTDFEWTTKHIKAQSIPMSHAEDARIEELLKSLRSRSKI